MSSSGTRFRKALRKENPLQIVGVINAYAALMAGRVGYRALYLSGAGVANASYGLPDLGMTSMNDVLEDVGRITAVTDTPLLVDIDTGWGSAFNIARTVKSMIRAGAGAVHIEDQVSPKRCGQRPNKVIVSIDEMCDRIKAAVDAKTDEQFVVMARTDALAGAGLDAVVERVCRFAEAGADAIFAEAMTDLDMYRRITEAVELPVLANLTEFGNTPLYSLDELRSVGVRMTLYPMSAFRAMSLAALRVYTTIREEGTQRSVVETMQSREELYDLIGYESYESSLDELFATKADSDAGNGEGKPDS